jgi:DNA-binding CsgD family transcriptional regulator/PAS domain-containing protein
MGEKRFPARKVDLTGLILDIHAMALDRDAWEPTIRKLASLFNADKALFFSPSPDAARLPGVAVGLDPEILAAYAAHWCQHDVWTQQAALRGLIAKPQVLVGEQLIDHREFIDSIVYNECLRHNGVGRLMTAPIVPARDSHSAAALVGAFYRAADRPGFDRGDRDVYQSLLPHLALAMRAFAKIARLEAATRLWQLALESTAEGVLLLGPRGRVLSASPRAEHLLRKTGCLNIRGGRLMARGAVTRHLAGVMEGRRADGVQHISVMDGAGGIALRITAIPIPASMGDASDAGRAEWVMFLDLPVPRPEARSTAATELYGLTRGEGRVLTLLLHGCAPRRIAGELGISVQTVRTHLKRLYLKTGTSGQRDLLAKVASL